MPKILITGACGEIGLALLNELALDEQNEILTLDLQDLPDGLREKSRHVKGSILDKALIDGIAAEYEIDVIYHLAALLSTSAERTPFQAHQVNVDGTAFLLEIAAQQSEQRGKPALFLFPSSKAVYGMLDLKAKAAFSSVKEGEWNFPATMYGINKLYSEMLGDYYSRRHNLLDENLQTKLDFRALRFPGLISAHTVPSGGTSDYGPEMLHAAAKGEPYACFVRPDTTIAFMAMPDAIKALLQLAAAPQEKLSRTAYNVTSFSLSAEEFRQQVLRSFPDAQITFAADAKRQQIVDSWPMNIDDGAARRDWDWTPDYDLQRCFNEYLVPNIRERYRQGSPE
jgi:nucleoside-diphosphate-sugar epimerase